MKVRLDPARRRDMIVRAGILHARTYGIGTISPENVADRCSVKTSAATVRRYFLTQSDLVGAIVNADPSFRSEAVTRGMISCDAVRQGDEMFCASCNARWGVDESPAWCGQ